MAHSSSRCRSVSDEAIALLLAISLCLAQAFSQTDDITTGGTRSTGTSTSCSSSHQPSSVVVVGSVNLDLTMEVCRLPSKGETTISHSPKLSVTVGGKGANQAVAAARLTQDSPSRIRFICRFGNDGYAEILEREIVSNGVDVTGCKRVPDMLSGHGMVMLEPDGAASSVVVGGANTAWTEGENFSHIVSDAAVVLLQREIPDHVNLAVAAAAAEAGVPVILDVGGEDRPLSDELLRLVDYLVPNQLELRRLTNMTTDSEQQVASAAEDLINRGARNVLVTLAERGSVLVTSHGSVLKQEALPIPGGVALDGTAAGDAFRAAFAVALVEGHPLQHCLQFAAAAGAVAVSKLGAVPSLPTRGEVVALLDESRIENSMYGTASYTNLAGTASDIDADGTCSDTRLDNARAVVEGLPQEVTAQTSDSPATNAGTVVTCSQAKTQSQHESSSSTSCRAETKPDSYSTTSNGSSSRRRSGKYPCPYKFASRLNSMKSRRDLVQSKDLGATLNNVLGWIARQGQVKGLDLVYLNYPQHLEGATTQQIKDALKSANVAAGAVCIRFPPAQFQLGAFTHPYTDVWQAAVDLAVAGCRWAVELDASELVVWSPFDGYDYHFQIDYHAAWARTRTAFQQLADRCPTGVKISLEFKATDENTRFSVVSSIGAALLLASQVNRPNFGLTLDVGHLLMAGENPAQSIAMVAAAGKLFGVQLNDAHVKLGAEDGLAFGSVNPVMALELVYWLRKVKFAGHVYFDTFPVNEDPVREAEYNIRQFKKFWDHAAALADAGLLNELSRRHDAIGVLELLEGTLPEAASAKAQ